MMENPAGAGCSPTGLVDHRPVSAPKVAQTRAPDLPKRRNGANLSFESGIIWRIPVKFEGARMLFARSRCAFFHTIDLPNGEIVQGPWDFRRTEAAYHGGYNLKGKRVLEIGAASGCHSFWMEGQGADVVPYDLSPKHSWDILLAPGQSASECDAEMEKGIEKINNGWHYSAERLGSRLKLAHGTIYDIPAELGDFDVITFGSVLLHTRDPIGAVQKAAKRAREAIIITDRVPTHLDVSKPLMEFMPRIGMEKPWGGWTWWWYTPEVMVNLLKIMGYTRLDLTMSKHLYAATGREIELFTLVGRH